MPERDSGIQGGLPEWQEPGGDPTFVSGFAALIEDGISNIARTRQSSRMETMGDTSSWLTPAIIIGLFLWLRADIRALEGGFEKLVGRLEERFEKRFDGVDKRLDGFDERLRAVGTSQAEIKGSFPSCATSFSAGTCRRRSPLPKVRLATDPAPRYRPRRWLEKCGQRTDKRTGRRLGQITRCR